MLAAAARALPSRAADVRLTIDPDVPPVSADAAQLERAFANLLENAAALLGRTAGVGAAPAAVGARVVVRVVDQGPGIAPRERDRIFEPFYRGPHAGGRALDRAPVLGLAIAKGFVEANGGTISVESLPGQGSSFVVSLPIGAVTAAEPSRRSPT